MQGRIERIELDRVVPYWRNPRNLSNEAVEAVKTSIEEYGYNQPIVVDKDYTIIIGHTRYAAMRRMEQAEVDVVVADHLTPQQVKQLRVVDNRAGEYAFWDFDKLQEEVADMDSQLLADLFPEILSHLQNDEAGNGPTVDWATEEEDPLAGVDPEVEFVCPKCFHEWETTVTREQIMSGIIESKKEASV
jgi:ParB-like chromosome segregation protein Spo0J